MTSICEQIRNQTIPSPMGPIRSLVTPKKSLNCQLTGKNFKKAIKVGNLESR